MGLSLSIEVQVPDDVDAASVTAIGERCYASTVGDVDHEPMGIGEAIQYAFNDPGGVMALATLGIVWTAIETA
jgi:hypothetical protein